MTHQETLESWQTQERAVRSRLSAVGTAPREKVFGMTGMQVFEGIFAGELPPPPIGDTMDFIPVHIEPGMAVFQGKPQLRHYNPLGTVHGGWIATLLDSAVGCSVHTLMEPGKTYTTLELKINYVKAVTHKVPLVRAVVRNRVLPAVATTAITGFPARASSSSVARRPATSMRQSRDGTATTDRVPSPSCPAARVTA